MGRRILMALPVAVLVGAALATLASAQEIPSAETVVAPKVLVSLQPVPRGVAVEVAVVAEIQKGFHVNSNTPRDDYLIPTTLTPELPAGLKVVQTTYPKGQVRKFEFSETPLDVYDGTLTIRMKLEVANNAPIGPMKLPMILRYQACNNRACLRPVKLPVVAELKIAEAGTKVQTQHPNVFGRPKKK